MCGPEMIELLGLDSLLTLGQARTSTFVWLILMPLVHMNTGPLSFSARITSLSARMNTGIGSTEPVMFNIRYSDFTG